MWCVWLSSLARSCATRDASNKDNVCKPTIPAKISRPPPSETISHVTRVPNHKTRYAELKDSFSAEVPCEKVSFYIRWRSRAKDREYRRRRRVTAGRTAGVTDRAQERPDKRDIRAGAEDAEYRSGSDAKKGDRLLLGT